MARVFISHSSRDAAAARWVADWLKDHGFDAPFLDFDKHSGIPPGADWERTLYREITTSQALLIVQSSHWNTSKWCFAEFTQARALGKPIYQLVGVPGTSEGDDPANLAPISRDLQQLDLRHDRATALEALARELTALALNDRGGFPWEASRPPFPGLLSFDQDDAAIFFGRDREIRELIEQLQVLRIHGSGRLVVVLGASGSGKSSLLRAGVLPRLARSGRHWLSLPPLRPRGAPTEALAQALAHALQDDQDWRRLHQRLREAEASGVLSTLLSELAADLRLVHQAPEAQILISVDQAEELFTEADPQAVRHFFTILSTALAPGDDFQVVMTLRSDFLGSLQAADGLAVPLWELSLLPLPSERLADIIKGPARVAGLTVEEAFVRAAIRDAHTEDALPLLAFALREIYDLGGADHVLSLFDYEALGDPTAQLSPLENAVRRAADGVLALCRPSEEERQALREAFVPALVRINEQDAYTRRPARWDDLPPQSWPLLNQLAQARLLTIEQRGQERWVEVAHEALLRKWPLLNQWLDDARDFLVGTQRLEQDLRDWQAAASEHKSASLLNGLKLTRARTWLQELPRQIQPELRSFIEASIARHDRLIQRERRSQRLIIGGLSLLTLVAGGAWVWGLLRNRDAHEAQTRQFQSVHLSMLEIDPTLSLVQGLAAMARLKDNDNEALPLAISLDHAASLNSFRGQRLSGHDEVWSLAETPGGRLISGGRDGTLRIWNARGQREPQIIQTNHPAGIRGIVATSDQAWWTAGDEGRLQRWVAGKPQGPAIPTGHGSIQSLTRALDGSLLSIGTDGLLRRWDARSGKALGPALPSGHLEVWSVAVLPNGDWVTGGREGMLQWWHQGQRRGSPIASGQGAVSALVALPSGEIVSGGDNGSLRFWKKNGQSEKLINSGHSSIFTLLWRKDGTVLSGGSERLATANQGSFIRTWAAKKPRNLRLVQPGQMESLSIIELCNGDLISGGSDGALHHWRDGRRLGQPIQTQHRRMYALALLPSGDIVSGGEDGVFQTWRNGQPVAKTRSEQGGVTSLTALADGSLFSGGHDGTIKHWSMNGKLMPANTIQTRHGAVWAIALLPNGDVLSGGDDGFLRRWHKGRQVGRAIKTPHTTVASLVVRRNGDWVTGGSGGDIQLWRKGQPLGDYFQVGSGSVWSLVERRDGSLISANGDGTVFVYPTPAQAMAEACRQLRISGQVADPREPAAREAHRLCGEI